MGTDNLKKTSIFTSIHESNVIRSPETYDLLEKYEEILKEQIIIEANNCKNINIFLSDYFCTFYRGMLILESLNIVDGEKIQEKIKINLSYANWLLSSEFLKGRKYKYLRNFGADPVISKMLIEIKSNHENVKVDTNSAIPDHNINFMEPFETPLLSILSSLRNDQIKELFEPLEPGYNIKDSKLKISEADLIDYIKTSSLTKERPEIQLARDKLLVENLTGLNWDIHYIRDSTSACRILYLFFYIRHFNGGSLKSLIDSISVGSEALPVIPWNCRSFNLSAICNDEKQIKKNAHDWLINFDDRYSLDLPCTLSELFSYLLFNSRLESQLILSSLFSWFQSIVNHFAICCVSGETREKRRQFGIISGPLIQSETLRHSKILSETSDIFEMTLYGIVIKFIEQNENCVAKVHDIISDIKLEKIGEKHPLFEFLTRTIGSKYIHQLEISTKDKNSVFILRVAALLQMLITMKVITESESFLQKNIISAVNSVFNCIKYNIKVPYKKPKKKSKTGKADPIHSLTEYGKSIFFVESSSSESTPTLPRIHALFWQELFLHIKHDIEPGLYLKSRRIMSKIALTSLISSRLSK